MNVTLKENSRKFKLLAVIVHCSGMVWYKRVGRLTFPGSAGHYVAYVRDEN